MRRPLLLWAPGLRLCTVRAHCCDVSWGYFPGKGVIVSTMWIFRRPPSGSHFQLATVHASPLTTVWPDAGEAWPGLT